MTLYIRITFSMFQCYRNLFLFSFIIIYFLSICLSVCEGATKSKKSSELSSSEDIGVGSKDVHFSNVSKKIEKDVEEQKERNPKDDKGLKISHQISSKSHKSSGNTNKKDDSISKDKKKRSKKKSNGYRKLYRSGKIKRNMKIN